MPTAALGNWMLLRMLLFVMCDDTCAQQMWPFATPILFAASVVFLNRSSPCFFDHSLSLLLVSFFLVVENRFVPGISRCHKQLWVSPGSPSVARAAICDV